MKKITITRADGSEDFFSDAKMKRSLTRAGANNQIAEEIVSIIKSELKPGMTTGAIYRRAFALLKKRNRPVAAVYSLKQALMKLGPTGYPFEQFIGRLLAAKGYYVTYPEITYGRCLPHEIDVVASKPGRKIMVEAKFHNQLGYRTGAKDALYIHARFLDVSANPANKFTDGYLITNTKFSSDAIRYAQCVNLHLIGWNYPSGQGIAELIEEANLHPITALTTLNSKNIAELLRLNIITCSDLIQASQKLKSQISFSHNKLNRAINEASQILNPKT